MTSPLPDYNNILGLYQRTLSVVPRGSSLRGPGIEQERPNRATVNMNLTPLKNAAAMNGIRS